MTTTTAGRERTPRARLLEAASRLFYRDGIVNTGVDAIAAAAGVSKRTLYVHFRSKPDLVAAYLEQIDASGGMSAERVLLGDDPPRERLSALFDVAPRGRVRGCAFHNAAVESAGTMPTVDAVVRRHKELFRDKLADVAREAGVVDAEELADQLAVLFEGMTALMTSMDATAPARAAQAAARTLIAQAIGSDETAAPSRSM